MNTTKESAADAAAVTTKIAPKIAARQMAEDTAPAQPTKEEAPVQIWLCLEGSGRTTGTLDVPCGLRPPETGACAALGLAVCFQEER